MCSEPEKVQSQKRFKSQQIQLPHDIASRTAHTAVGVGISPNQANVLMISSVIANFGGDLDKVALSLTSSKRISRTVNDAEIIRSNIA